MKKVYLCFLFIGTFILGSCGATTIPPASQNVSVSPSIGINSNVPSINPSINSETASKSKPSSTPYYGLTKNLKIKNYSDYRSLSVVSGDNNDNGVRYLKDDKEVKKSNDGHLNSKSPLNLVLENNDGSYSPAEFVYASDDNVLTEDLNLTSCVIMNDLYLLSFSPYSDYIQEPRILGKGEVYSIPKVHLQPKIQIDPVYRFLLNTKNGLLFSLDKVAMSMAGIEEDGTNSVHYIMSFNQSFIDSSVLYVEFGSVIVKEQIVTGSRVEPSAPGPYGDTIYKMVINDTIEYSYLVDTKIGSLPVIEDRYGNIQLGNYLYNKDYDLLNLGYREIEYDIVNHLFKFGDSYYINDSELRPLKGQYVSLYGAILLAFDGENYYYQLDKRVYKVKLIDDIDYESNLIFEGNYIINRLIINLNLEEGYCSTFDLVTLKTNTSYFENESFSKMRILNTSCANSNIVIHAYERFEEVYYYLNYNTGEISKEPIIADRTVYIIYPINADDYFEEIGWANRTFYDMSNVSFEDATIEYDGEEHYLLISGELPKGVEVSYTENALTEVGSIIVTASFSSKAKYYEPIPDMVATLTIIEPVEPTSEGI